MNLSLRPSVNWLFAFVPITVALEHVGGFPAPFVFFAAALAIVPIAGVVVQATEQIATRTVTLSGAFSMLPSATRPNSSSPWSRCGSECRIWCAHRSSALSWRTLLTLGVGFSRRPPHPRPVFPQWQHAPYSTMMLLAAISLGVQRVHPHPSRRIDDPEGNC